MKQIREMLEGVLPKRDIMVTAEAQTVLREWPAIVGEFLANRAQPDRFVKGVVYVSAEDSTWAQEVHLHKEEILDRLNERAGRKLFLDIRITGTRRDRE